MNIALPRSATIASLAFALAGLPAVAQSAEPPGAQTYKLRGTPDPAATGGEAKTLPQAGIYCWWDGPALKPGYFEITARARAIAQPGLLHFVLCHSGQEAPPAYAVSRTQHATIEPGAYREYYCGTFYFDGSYTPRVSDWSSGGLMVDWVRLTPVAMSAIRDPDPATVKRVLAPRFAGPPRLDGELGEWGRVPALVLGADSARSARYGGTADLSAVCRWAWDDKALYFAAEVHDNRAEFLLDASALSGLWQFDSIQMAFDAAHNARTPGYDRDDYEYGFGLTAAGPRAYRWATGNDLPLGDVPNVSLAVKRDDAAQLTTYEIALPWTDLVPFSPRNPVCGMTLIVNDNDGDGPQRGWLEWTPGIAGPKDPSAFGQLQLLDQPPAATEVLGWLVGESDLSDQPEGRFTFQLSGPAPDGASTLRWRRFAGDKPVAQGEIPVTMPPPWPLVVDLRGAGQGALSLQAELVHDGTVVAEAWASFHRFAVAALHERLARIRERQQALWQSVQAWREAHGHGWYPRATLGVVGEFVTHTADDLKERKCERAEQVMGDLEAMLAEAAAELDALEADPRRDMTVPPSSAARLTAHDGGLFDGDRPVFLLGFCGWWQVWTQCRRLADMGMNMAEDSIVLPFGLFPTPDRQPPKGMLEGTDWAWLRGDENHFRYSRMLACNQLPEYLEEQCPDAVGGGWGGWCTLSPGLREFEGLYLDTVAGIAAKHTSPAVHVLYGENTHALSRHPLEVAAFRAWLAERYGGVTALNQAWGTHYASLDEVGNGDQAASPAAWHDRGRFNQQLFTDWTAWLVARAKAADPRALCTGYPSLLSWDDSSDFSAGIDMEALCGALDVNGCDTAALDYGGKRWAMSSITGFAMAQDLLQAFRPDHPNYDPELHLVNLQQPYPPAYIHAALWQGFLHGLSAASAWVYERRDGIDSMLTFQPRVMEAYLRAGLDLRRLVPEVRAFQRAPAEAALLYSLTSVAYNPQHLPELRSAYEGTFFLDAKMGFVTERTVLRDGLRGVKLLAVPEATHVPAPVREAILEWVREGGTLWLAGDALSRDDRDRPLPALGRGRIVRTKAGADYDAWRTQAEKLYTLAGVEQTRRVVTPAGRSVDGVECRTVRLGGRELVYLINMNKAPVAVTISPAPPRLRDLVHDQSLQLPLHLEPLDVVLTELGR
ncbi:MAG: hypothetical protein HYU66_09880 [Armatimonadetes bacterium]|nr:hypothetical protein [Armatimonadota bacterium]